MTLSTIMIDNGYVESKLEIPSGRDPEQNAWLTLSIGYELHFADSKNRVPGVIVSDGGKVRAKDSDGDLFPIQDWDFPSIVAFQRTFARGEKIWNWQFTLITPSRYDGLDYESMSGRGWVVRPNVLCLFRLAPSRPKTHLRINVVRLDPSIKDSKAFRSSQTLYDNLDVWTTTLGHELGHALGQGHIKELLGDAKCIADAKKGIFPDRCYGETPSEKANIMGSGGKITEINAGPWLKRIEEHTQIPMGEWKVTTNMNIPTRKIPLGVGLVGKPVAF